MSFFFFFKQKTAYEMRISDWSSDVLFRSGKCRAERRTDARGGCGGDQPAARTALIGDRIEAVVESERLGRQPRKVQTEPEHFGFMHRARRHASVAHRGTSELRCAEHPRHTRQIGRAHV